MDKVTQSNAANAEESAAAAEELTVQAARLREAVSDLLRLVDGQGRQAGASASLVSTPDHQGAKGTSATARKPTATGDGHDTRTIRSNQPERPRDICDNTNTTTRCCVGRPEYGQQMSHFHPRG